MLKLRKVELVGFKSFCEKTHLTFSGTGLSCIIGPNGCGKSNIVDAISWVLGEQSTKSLRAERMADCIFNGTVKRPPLGLAEVTLTLVDHELADAARRVLGSSDLPMAAETGPVAAALDGEIQVEVREIADDAALGDAPAAEATSIEDGKPLKKKRGSKHHHEPLPGEVVIGRRLYRSGQSEYLINGRAARLRDVQDLFMGIGLGPDSYAIIEQGRIGQVLSSKPSDRRAIIEEAAGITKYKTKRRLAEAKLESSKLNLSRVNDIYVEVEKQLASLKRQAAKARRYAEIRDLMRGLLRRVLASKATELDREASHLEQLLAAFIEDEARQAQTLGLLETEQQTLDKRAYDLDAELRQNQNLVGQAALEVDRTENRILFNRRRSEELRGRARQVGTEHEQAAAQLAAIESRVGAHAEVVSRLREEVESLNAILAEISKQASDLAGSGQATESQMAGLHRTMAELDTVIARLHATQTQAEQALAHHSGALERLEQSERAVLEESLYHRERGRVAEIRWHTATEQAKQIEQAIAEAQTRLAALRDKHRETTTRYASVRDELSTARARRQTLEQILNERSYTADAVQKLFAPGAGNEAGSFRASGVLADYAEVESPYESAVEQFLKDELEYVVVETFDHARAGIAMLRDEVGGRATFFVDSLEASHVVTEPGSATPFDGAAGVVSRLDQLVEFRSPLGPAAKQFLPRLHSAFLIENSETAERLARDNPSFNFLTTDGTCYQGRSVSGGRPNDAGPLAMKRELRLLEIEALRLEQKSAEARAELEHIASAQRESEQSLQETAAEQVQAEKAVSAATVERDQSRSELARLGMELSSCQKDLERLRNEAQAARQKAAEAIAQSTAALARREEAAREVAASTTRIAELRQRAQERQAELSAKREERAALGERFRSAEELAARMQEEQRELSVRAAGLIAQQAAMAAEQEEIIQQNQEQEQQVESLRAERARLEARQNELDHERKQARVRTAEVDEVLRGCRQKLTGLREERGHHEVEQARNGAEREHLRATCIGELNAQPEDLIAEQPALMGGEELAAADAQYLEMKARIEAMGAVNMMALEEYNECEQRFDFLGRERGDLLQSITDTQQAIGELDLVSRQKFEEAFSIINTHFASAFQTLFGGGTGQMRLSEADSGGETGIDIAAQPPGKRLQNVLLLSGGEKALTALALLIAIFRYQPSPFCILDEVDAPLDETNVGRFAQMVADMSADAQFIVVTHNRRTMEMASVLYGVTMQEPGVSKLVSVNWEQARAATASHAA